MKNENIKDIIAENRRRTARLADNYDPISGQGCLGERITVRRRGGKDVLVPATMTADPSYRKQMSAHDFNQLRQRHDFEYWCATCVTVKDKSGYADVRLRLNRPQRIIAGVLERQRTASQPIRAILLKARQLGGSTVVQAYMAWLQLLHRDNWHSLICAHVKDAAQTIRGMMSKLLASYPEEYLPAGGKSLRLTSFEGSRTTVRQISDSQYAFVQFDNVYWYDASPDGHGVAVGMIAYQEEQAMEILPEPDPVPAASSSSGSGSGSGGRGSGSGSGSSGGGSSAPAASTPPASSSASSDSGDDSGSWTADDIWNVVQLTKDIIDMFS